MKWVVIRLMQGVLLLVVLSILVFVFADFAPGDFLAEAELDPRVSQELIEKLRENYGLEDSLHVRYGRWVASVFRGEGGYSLAYRRPVLELMLPRIGHTLILATVATLLSWLLALATGILSAYRRGGWIDRSLFLVVVTLLAIPEVLLALGGLILAVNTDLPLGGATSLDYQTLTWAGQILDWARHLFIPVGVLTLASVPALIRHVRSAVIEALEQPFVAAARGHGIGGARLLVGYVMPAASNPLITLFGFSFGGLVSGSMLVEEILGWPGMGPLVLDSLMSKDLHVLNTGTVVICLFLLTGNLVADLLRLLIDPKVRDV